jgi:hypothetical protein
MKKLSAKTICRRAEETQHFFCFFTVKLIFPASVRQTGRRPELADGVVE